MSGKKTKRSRRRELIPRGMRSQIAKLVDLSINQVTNIIQGNTKNEIKHTEIKLALKTLKRKKREEAIRKLKEKLKNQ